MSTIKTGGALLQLPQEVRDEIYSHYFNKEYFVFWCYSELEDSKVTIADLAILRTSNAISSDAMNSLFSRAASKAITFIYDFKFNPIAELSTPPTKEATKRMMNVEFKVSIEPEFIAYRAIAGGFANGTLYLTSRMDPICEASIDHFTGISIVRDQFRIRVQVLGFGYFEHFLGFMKTRFFQTLKNMQGFRKLTLVLEMVNLFRDGISIEKQQDIGMVAAELEPYLGPYVAKSLTHERWEKWLHLVYELEFHPQEFQIESLRAKAVKLTKDVKDSREDSSG